LESTLIPYGIDWRSGIPLIELGSVCHRILRRRGFQGPTETDEGAVLKYGFLEKKTIGNDERRSVMASKLKGKDILATSDWDKSEMDQVLDLAFKFKKMGTASRSLDLLKGKTLLLLFFRPSTRTRISFTAAMQELEGFVQCPDPGDLRLSLEEKPGAGESLKDTARVVERYVDAVAIRVGGPILDETGAPRPGAGDTIMRKFADYTKVPVINLGSDLHHPTQAIADIMVMKEHVGDLKGKKIAVMWAYSPLHRNLVSPLSDILVSATYGMNVSVVYPEGYDLDASVMSLAQKESAKAGGKLEISHDLKNGLKGADVVFPRNWWSPRYYMNTKDEEQRLAAKYKDWRLTESLLQVTNNARFIHVMPFDRGNEVDDSVADGPNSVVYDQAENLLHVRKALLALLLAESSLLENI
jgi:ornithine carbamoyltransferase